MSAGKLPAFRHALEELRRYSSGERLLDVGCAFGQFVHVSQQMGYVSSGIELDSLLAARARDFGLRVIGGDFITAAFAGGEFDIITFWYMLEHVLDPMQCLQKSYRLLRRGGVLFVRVPNMLFGLPFLYARLIGLSALPSILSHIPAHLFFYTPATIRCLIESAGFRVLKIEHGVPVSASSSRWPDQLSNSVRRIVVDIADFVAVLSKSKVLPGPYLTVYARKEES